MNAICIKSVENDGKNFIKGHKYDFTFKFDSLDHRPPYTEYDYAGICFYDPFTAKAENKLCFDDYFKISDPNFIIVKEKDSNHLKCRKDKNCCILRKARLVRWLEPIQGGKPKQKVAILSPGDMYVENTEYIPLAEILALPKAK